MSYCFSPRKDNQGILESAFLNSPLWWANSMTTSRNAETPWQDKGCPIFKTIPGHPGGRCQGYFTMDGQGPQDTVIQNHPLTWGSLMKEAKRTRFTLQPPEKLKTLQSQALRCQLAELSKDKISLAGADRTVARRTVGSTCRYNTVSHAAGTSEYQGGQWQRVATIE